MSAEGWPLTRALIAASYRARALTRWQNAHQREDDAARWQRVSLPVGVRHRTCQWPLTTKPALFCAAPVAKPGCSWCADHARIVFAQKEAPGG